MLRRSPTGSWRANAGHWVAEALAAEGVPAEFAWGAGETRSSLSVADSATGRLTEFYEDGTPANAEDWAQLVQIVESFIGSASWLALQPRSSSDVAPECSSASTQLLARSYTS